MRRPVDAADPARHTLLGLLLDGPNYGYVLARAFAPGSALGNVMYLGASHLYALLAQLERDGLVGGARLEQGARPTRRVYQLTGAGRDTVLHWIDAPVSRPRDVLLDFPLKLYLAQRLGSDRALTLIERQRGQFTAYLAELEAETAPAGAAVDQPFIRLMQDGRIERTRATITWLDRCAVTLKTAVSPRDSLMLRG